MSTIIDVPVVLLVGGMGTRLRPVLPSTPKALATVGDRAFLELLIRQLKYQGFRRLVMCTGFLAHQIEDKFGDGTTLGVAIEYSREQHPLGTAGAVKLAQSHLERASQFIVMNGDSFLETDFDALIRLHRGHDGLASITVFQVADTNRYGTVQIAARNRVIGFTEKSGPNVPGLVNAGVYIFNSEIFEYIPDGPASLERDVFPRILGRGVYALEQHGLFIDIGTPEDYARAQALCDQLNYAGFRR
jgi:NDP-sugar pyrophosphorylase family protein